MPREGHRSVSMRDRSKRAELQRLLGEIGTVLPRVERGSIEKPAQGWYARVEGKLVFLGDHTALAAAGIQKLVEENTVDA